MSAILSPAYAAWRPETTSVEPRVEPLTFSARDFTSQALDAAELAELTQLIAQRELCQRGNIEAIVTGLAAVDPYASKQQLAQMTMAFAQLAEKLNGSFQSAEMASYVDAINDALGWAESMAGGEDTPLHYGGTDD